MKYNIKNYLIVAIGSLFLATSCSGFLEEKTNGQVFETVLSTEAGLESALTGAYRGWQVCWSYGFINGWATEMTIGGDDLTCPSTAQNTFEFDSFSVTNTNSSISPVYQGAYKAIQGANNVLENYETCEGNEEIITAIAGEAYFIRAFSYYWLVRCHGELPLVLGSTFSIEDLSMELSSVKEIYDQIESDLANAISMLSNGRRNGEYGRPNIGTAKALLAEVYLTEAGWPLNETSKYALAASTAKDVIENRALYGFDFEESYEILFKNDETSSGMSKEEVFVIPCDISNGNAKNATYGNWAYPNEIGGWDVVFSELKFYNDYPEGPRKDATFATTITKKSGETIWWENLKYARPYYKKLWISENSSNFYTTSTQIPMRMLRFSQTALTYAEAMARTSAPDALSYECLNTIRERAGLPTYSGLSSSDFADACVQERAWEFCGERVRWFDLVRLEMVEEVAADKDPLDTKPVGTITKDDYTFPVPQRDELLNPNLNAN